MKRALLLMIVSACGAGSVASVADRGTGRDDAGAEAEDAGILAPDGAMAPAPSGALPPLSVAWVPGGPVYVGGWTMTLGLATNGGQAANFLRSTECEPATLSAANPTGSRGVTGNKVVTTNTVSLMVDAVTNATYAPCVDAGKCTPIALDPNAPLATPWNDPAMANYPATPAYDGEAAFCAWAGGRLPTLAELLRATQGDTEGPGNSALVGGVTACLASPSSFQPNDALCTLTNDNIVPELPIRSVATDIGPYGHYDLMTGLWQTTSSEAYEVSETFCSLADGASDSPALNSAIDETSLDAAVATNTLGVAGGIGWLRYIATLRTQWLSADDGGILPFDPFLEVGSFSSDSYIHGFRCAFDP